jgi:hypothetical protein
MRRFNIHMEFPKVYSFLIGIGAIILGLWGFFQQPVLDIFGVNTLHNIIHLVAGPLGIYAALADRTQGYITFIAWAGTATGILGFLPYTKELLAQVLHINYGISVLHLGVGLISIGVLWSMRPARNKA